MRSELPCSTPVLAATGVLRNSFRRPAMRRVLSWLLIVGGLAILVTPPRAVSADWPQWLGEDREGVWRETGLLERFPASGPKVLWRAPLGAGNSGPAV